MGVKKFEKELKKALYTALIAAFGFLIAFVWRDLIQLWVNKIAAASPITGQLMSALIVTIVCAIGILIVTRYLKEE